MVLMENVAGIMRVQDALKFALRTVEVYNFYLIPWDPRQLGEPVRRPPPHFGSAKHMRVFQDRA